MIPGLNPKKVAALMKQMGMSQEDIGAKRVIIEKSDNTKIVIENPSVAKVKMQGQETFQISGDISEKASEENENNESDIEMIIEKTNKSREEVALALEKNNGDIAQTIIELS